jgi:hypothetical protein
VMASGEDELKHDFREFVDRMPPVRTENARLASHVLRVTGRSRAGAAEHSR